jgi:hypothetical protein
MQVGLATTSLAANDVFQSASCGFTIFAIIGPLVGTTLILVLVGYIYVHNFVIAFILRPRISDSMRLHRV